MKEKLFAFVWQEWLQGCSVVEVKGWRTALVTNKSGLRSRVTPMFFWERCGRPWWQYRQDLWRMVFGQPKPPASGWGGM